MSPVEALFAFVLGINVGIVLGVLGLIYIIATYKEENQR